MEGASRYARRFGSLRRCDPDQVQRVWSQPRHRRDTPTKVAGCTLTHQARGGQVRGLFV